KCDYHAIDFSIGLPVRTQAGMEHTPVAAPDFTLQRGRGGQHAARVLFERSVLKTVGEIADRALPITGFDVEDLGELRCEAADTAVKIQKERSHVRGCHKVLKIAIGV